MKAGTLRHFCTIDRLTDARDELGGVVDAWETFKSVYASIEPVVGRNFQGADQTQSGVTHKIRIRYTEGVLPNMRLTHKGVHYYFIAIMNIDTRNREIVISASDTGNVGVD